MNITSTLNNISNSKTCRTAGPLFLALCSAGIALALTGCSTPRVHTEHDGEVGIAAYKTFFVLPLAATGVGTDPGEALRLAGPAQQVVREVLVAKGLTEAARDQADCAVLVRGESLPRVEVTDWGYTPYPAGVRRRGWVSYGGYRDVDVNTTMDRRLVIEIYDNASHKLAWVGWAERSGSGPVKPEKLQDCIRRILADFPPGSKRP